MRADGWSVGFSVVGLIVVVGMYACLRYAIPHLANEPEVLLYGLVGLGPYALAAYGSGAARRGSWARPVANAAGVVVCLVGAYWLWLAADESVQVRAIRDAGRDHAIPGSVFMVLVFLPIQGVAGAIAAVVGGVAHDARRR